MVVTPPSCPNSHNGMSGPGQTTPAISLPTGHGTGGSGTGSNGHTNAGPSTRREGTANRWNPNSLQCFRCQGCSNMAREMSYPSDSLKPAWGDQGNVANPLPAKVAPANRRPHAFSPQPQTNTSQHDGRPKDRLARNCPSHSILKSRSSCPPCWMIQ